MAVPPDYAKDYQYLKTLSDRGALDSNNAIYKRLDDKARNLPELRSALGSLRVKYV